MMRTLATLNVTLLALALSGCKTSGMNTVECTGDVSVQIVFDDDLSALTAEGDYEFRLTDGGTTATCRAEITGGKASVSPCSSSTYSLFTIDRGKIVGDALTPAGPTEIGGIDFSEFGNRAPDLTVLRNGEVIFTASGPEWSSEPRRDCVAHSWYAAVPNVEGGAGGAGGASQ